MVNNNQRVMDRGSDNWMSVPTGLGFTGTPTVSSVGGPDWNTPAGWGPALIGTTTYDITRTPLVDVTETDNHILLSVELPGVRKEDIDLDAREYSIDVSVTGVETPSPDEPVRYSRDERGVANGFYRTITLPLKVDPNNISAKFENGLLQVTVEKTDENKHRSEHVEIQ